MAKLFKLLGIPYLVGKIKFKLLFQGPLAKWQKFWLEFFYCFFSWWFFYGFYHGIHHHFSPPLGGNIFGARFPGIMASRKSK